MWLEYTRFGSQKQKTWNLIETEKRDVINRRRTFSPFHKHIVYVKISYRVYCIFLCLFYCLLYSFIATAFRRLFILFSYRFCKTLSVHFSAWQTWLWAQCVVRMPDLLTWAVLGSILCFFSCWLSAPVCFSSCVLPFTSTSTTEHVKGGIHSESEGRPKDPRIHWGGKMQQQLHNMLSLHKHGTVTGLVLDPAALDGVRLKWWTVLFPARRSPRPVHRLLLHRSRGTQTRRLRDPCG